MKDIIKKLNGEFQNGRKGLPSELFYFISKLTPIVNVDLLIKNKNNETLLTWRDDNFYGPAWHIPGGIIRFKETLGERIHKVAALELKSKVCFQKEPLNIREQFAKDRDERGHFISILHLCNLTAPLDKTMMYKTGSPKSGEWRWFKKAPKNLLPVHKSFIPFIEKEYPIVY